MRFGFMLDFRNPKRWHLPSPEFYAAMIEQTVRGEALGYDHVWLTEHHFTDDAYNPASLSMAAALAVRTSRIRIGTFVLLLPFISPVRAAEDAILADILSNGRFDLGMGQGYTLEEFDAFCVNRAERGARLQEGVALIKRLFTEEKVTFDGRFTKTKDMTLMPRCVQTPHPPLWVGARGPKGIRRAAELGANLMATLGPDPAPGYIQALKELGRNPADFKIAQLRMVYCAKTEEEAWEQCQHHLWHVFGYYADVLASSNDVEGDAIPMPCARAEELRSSPLADVLFVGTPDTVARKFEQFRKDFPCTDFIMSTHFAGIDPKLSTRSMELFAQEVMPAFR
ncbi:MAG: LLM class flavin-dependent oxidoreductase [Gammaproteobacteria bacterium]|nr:LLM class flavin-dependent oxidoreductase [Gammaproteobacteria bacterium]MBI5617690.1 LLM class flavin-dependent oxidoreductase [Gammaproteobacteria bacterium]